MLGDSVENPDLHAFDAPRSSSSVVGGVHGRPLLLQQRLRLLWKQQVEVTSSAGRNILNVPVIPAFTLRILRPNRPFRENGHINSAFLFSTIGQIM